MAMIMKFEIAVPRRPDWVITWLQIPKKQILSPLTLCRLYDKTECLQLIKSLDNKDPQIDVNSILFSHKKVWYWDAVDIDLAELCYFQISVSKKHSLTNKAILIIKIRQSPDHLIFKSESLYLKRQSYIQMSPRILMHSLSLL